MSDTNCDQASGQVCATDLGVCRLSTGELVDIATATVSFMGNSPGLIQETLLLVSNDGAATNESTHSVLLRANVVFSQLEIITRPHHLHRYVRWLYVPRNSHPHKHGNRQRQSRKHSTNDECSVCSGLWFNGKSSLDHRHKPKLFI